MRAENRILLIAFFLLLVLVTSADHDDGLRGGSRAAEDNNREVQLPNFPTVASFFAFLWSLLRRFAGAVLSVPTALLQFVLSLLFSLWNFVIGIFLSVSAPFTTTTTTTTTVTTSVPTTVTSTLAATTSSAFFSAEMTTPATSSSAGTAMSTVPTSLTSTLLSTSTASTLTSTSSSSTSTSSTSTSTSSTLTSTSSTSTSSSSTSTSTASTSTSTASTSTSTASTSTSTTGTTTSTIPPPTKTVFLTDARFLPNFGGLEGADTECNNAAQGVNLPGNFSAWLSNASHSPNTRFTRSLGPYLLIDGTKFADNYAALISGGPLVNLDLLETNMTVTGSAFEIRVWTGTDADGNAKTDHCNNWESNTNSFNGATGGSLTTISPDWTDVETIDCTNSRRLYCFEQ